MNRISISIIALLTLCSFGAYADPKIPAAQVSVNPALLSHSASTTVQAVLKDLDSAIPGSATTTTPGTVRFATPAEALAGTSINSVITPADLKAVMGSAPAITAFVTFSGNGTIIGTSFNVSSVTHSGTGGYVVNFQSAMSNANYGVVCSEATQNSFSSGSNLGINADVSPTTLNVTLRANWGGDNTAGTYDPVRSTVIIYGGK